MMIVAPNVGSPSRSARKVEKRRLILALTLALTLAARAEAQPGDSKAAPAASAKGARGDATARATRAQAILARMADFLLATPKLRMTAKIAYDAVQSDGENIEFGQTSEYLIRRPNEFRVDTMTRDGIRRGFRYDGEQIAVIDGAKQIYATAQLKGDIGKAFTFLQARLDIEIPLGDLLSGSLPRTIAQFRDPRWVAVVTLDGVPCDHLAARGPTVDAQIWVQQGDKPLPRRIVITYRKEKGQPQFRANITDWDLSPWLWGSPFTFRAPKGYERIGLLVRPSKAELRRAQEVVR